MERIWCLSSTAEVTANARPTERDASRYPVGHLAEDNFDPLQEGNCGGKEATLGVMPSFYVFW